MAKPGSSNDEFNIKDYLHLSFDMIHSELKSIKEKTDKTDASVQGIIRTINQMQLTDATHYQECPNTSKMRMIEKELSEYEFIKKYWKVFAISGVLTIILAIYQYMNAIAKINEYIKQKENSKNIINENISSKKLNQLDNITTYQYPIH